MPAKINESEATPTSNEVFSFIAWDPKLKSMVVETPVKLV